MLPKIFRTFLVLCQNNQSLALIALALLVNVVELVRGGSVINGAPSSFPLWPKGGLQTLTKGDHIFISQAPLTTLLCRAPGQ